MAMQTGKGSIFGKFGTRAQAAFKKHATDQIEKKNFGNLPAGVQGIARLVDIKFDVVKAEEGKDKKHVGEYYFYAAGVVVEPTTFTDSNGNKFKCAGLRTNVTEMVCDTPEKDSDKARKTVEQHLEWIVHLCRESLGAKFKSDSPQELENWVAAINTAIKSKTNPMVIYFNFETWKGNKTTTGKYANKEPMVQHFWRELASDYVAPNTAITGVQDNSSKPPVDEDEDEEETTEEQVIGTPEEEEPDTEENEEEEEETPKKKAKPSSNGSRVTPTLGGKSAINGKKASKKPTPAKDEEEETEDSEDDMDLVALAERADQHDDVKAKATLTAYAKKFGVSKEVVKNADSWAEVVALMQAPKKNEETEEEEEEIEEEKEGPEHEEDELETPEVDNVVGYRPVNKEGKEFKTPVECLVMKVSTKNKTVDLQNMSNQREYKGIPWNKISPWQS